MTIVFLVACTSIANRGTQESSLFNQIFTIGKMLMLAFILLMSIFYFNIGNYSPLLSHHHPEYGTLGIVVGATLVFFSYLGFDIIPAIAEEAKNPKKDVPRAIIHQILYVIVVYILMSFFVNGVGRLEDF